MLLFVFGCLKVNTATKNGFEKRPIERMRHEEWILMNNEAYWVPYPALNHQWIWFIPVPVYFEWAFSYT